MDIEVYGLIGYEGALTLYKENRAFLDARFPAFWIREFLELPEKLQHAKLEASDNQSILEIGKGGLFAALWNVCEELGCGCEVDIKSIPIAQEVVEICECFDKDPYEIESAGAWVVVSSKENSDAEASADIKADDLANEQLTIIGTTTDSKDRIILMGYDEKKKERARRFLTPPARQEKDLANSARK